jgi:hypothetical protein
MPRTVIANIVVGSFVVGTIIASKKESEQNIVLCHNTIVIPTQNANPINQAIQHECNDISYMQIYLATSLGVVPNIVIRGEPEKISLGEFVNKMVKEGYT